MRASRIRMAAAIILSLSAPATVVFGAGGAPNTDPGGGIGGTGISGFGAVQRFGSIFVNGREYILKPDTRVTGDSIATDTTALRLGQVVAVQGHIDQNSGRSMADRVTIRIVLEGRIAKLNVADGSFTILGETVRVPVSRGGSAAGGGMPRLSQLKLGEAVSVSGLQLANGAWDATYIAPTSEADASRFVMRGTAIAVDKVHGTIGIGASTFRISPSALTGVLSGEPVVITGQYENGNPAATSIRPDQPQLGKAGTAVEMSGYLKAQPASGLLVMNGVTLRVPSSTAVTGGTLAELKPGSAIAVRGHLRQDGSVAVNELMMNVDPMTVTLPPPPGTTITGQPGVNGDNGRKMENTDENSESNERNQRPNIDRPEIERPEVETPEIERPEISVPEMDR